MDITEDLIIVTVLTTTAVAGLAFFVVADLLLLSRNRKLKYRNDLLEINAGWEKEVQRSRTEAVDHVLHEMASELHDNVGQTLSLAVIQLNRLEINSPGMDKEPINEVRDSLRLALQDIRSMAHTISGLQDKQTDLRLALQRLKEKLQKSGWQIRLDIELPPENQDVDRQVLLLRIVQELVQNSLKYSGSKAVDISLVPVGDALQLYYNDYGKDWKGELSGSEGLGLRLIKDRLRLLGADWSISSQSPFILKAQIPFERSHEKDFHPAG